MATQGEIKKEYTSIDYLNDVRAGARGLITCGSTLAKSIKAAADHGIVYGDIQNAFNESFVANYLSDRDEVTDDKRAATIIDLHGYKFDKKTKKQLKPPAKDGKGYRTKQQEDAYGGARVAWIYHATLATIYVKRNVTRNPKAKTPNKGDKKTPLPTILAAPDAPQNLVIERPSSMFNAATQLLTLASAAQKVITVADQAHALEGDIGTLLRDAASDFAKYINDAMAKLPKPEETPKPAPKAPKAPKPRTTRGK